MAYESKRQSFNDEEENSSNSDKRSTAVSSTASKNNRGQSKDSSPSYTYVDDDKKAKKNQEKQSSAKGLKTAAKGAATYFGGPVGGKAVDLVSKTKLGNEVLNKGGELLNKMPGMGKTMKKLDDKGAIDALDKGLDLASNKGPSLPQNSPDDTNNSGAGSPPARKKNNFLDNNDQDENDPNRSGNAAISGTGTGKMVLKIAVIGILPILGFLILFIVALSSITNDFNDFGDALGARSSSGGETGGINYEASSPEEQEFLDRMDEVKRELQMQGKSVDILKISAVYHVLSGNDGNITYDTMTKDKILEIANAMFNGNSYSEEVFRENLTNDIFVQYFPNLSQEEREQLTQDVFNYIDDFFDYIGESNATCAASGSCIYEIQGFALGNSNITKEMTINNLQVRLMECGSPYGNGNYQTPIDQDLVPFESYVAGVAYAEIGPSAPDEAIKAQMVVARSYALARPTAMGNTAGKKLEEENGQWILQISSCVADQVFCNIDEGCSYMGGGDGQGGIVRSGIVNGAARTNPPLAEDHRLRMLAQEVQGEVLVNNQGYIINSGFLSTEQHIFMNLANQGMNYKQILLQVYNNGTRNYGASDIKKMNCNTTGSNNCTSGTTSTGTYMNWKQYDGAWGNVMLGTSGRTIENIGCLVTSISMLIKKSGVNTNVSGQFNPGSFVEYLNNHNGFAAGGNLLWGSVTSAAPRFQYHGQISLSGLSKEEKKEQIQNLLNQGAYIVAEVKGNTGQHWVAIDSISANSITMMDPGSTATDLWSEYNWKNTSKLAYFMVS